MAHVVVIGAAGGIGQPLSLLLKTQLPPGSKLSLYDVSNAVEGVAADLNHIDTPVQVVWATKHQEEHASSSSSGSSTNDDKECQALQSMAQDNVDIFVIVAGLARKPGMTRQDLFRVNARIVWSIVTTIGSASSNNNKRPCFCIVTNPVNSIVPVAAHALKHVGQYDANKLFGISTLDVMRATTFLHQQMLLGEGDACQSTTTTELLNQVPVVGGHSGDTIVPLWSQTTARTLSLETRRALTQRVQQAGTEIVQAKAGKGSATLSMAAAACRFVISLTAALTTTTTTTTTTSIGGGGIVYSYVDTHDVRNSDFFAIPIRLGPNGIQERLEIGDINEDEHGQLILATKTILKDIQAGNAFAQQQQESSSTTSKL